MSRLNRFERLVFGDPYKLPRHLARAAISERDTSNRTGDVRLGMFKGTLHGRKPHYSRSYSFELPVWYRPLQYPFFLGETLENGSSGDSVETFRGYVTEEMGGMITWALLGKYNLDISLTQQADREWRMTPPADFYDKLIDFYRQLHPSVVACVISRSDGQYPPAT